ncbi:hypothetical protein ACKWTF_005067 [Chironomus riparius]
MSTCRPKIQQSQIETIDKVLLACFKNKILPYLNMFSFFKSHNKKSPIASPVSERADDTTQKSSDDFVVVLQPNTIYPMPSVPQSSPHPFTRQFSMSVNYTQSVPFKLNPVLMSDSSDTEIWNFKLREMNSILQRVNHGDYDFKLERSIMES